MGQMLIWTNQLKKGLTGEGSKYGVLVKKKIQIYLKHEGMYAESRELWAVGT